METLSKQTTSANVVNVVRSSLLLFLSLFSGMSAAEGQRLIAIEIQAHIDGRDQLIVHGNTLQWHHFDFAAVGRHLGANSPTIIATKFFEDGSVNHVNLGEWIPEWPALPPDEIRFEAFSDVFENLAPPLASQSSEWKVLTRFGRGEVTIVEQPTEANDFALVVEFDDNAFAGSNFYIVRLIKEKEEGAYTTVFVTSLEYTGLLDEGSGGLAGGDAKCQARADAAGLPGTYTAWLSSSDENAKDRIPPGPYQLVNGDLVAENLSALVE